MWVCQECGCIPKSDFSWWVGLNYGKGSGWFCSCCGAMYEYSTHGAYLFGFQIGEKASSMLYYLTTPPPDGCTSFLEGRKLCTAIMNLNFPFKDGKNKGMT